MMERRSLLTKQQSDPLLFADYLGSRIGDLRALAVESRLNLFPMEGWSADASCRPTRNGPAESIDAHRALTEDFLWLEKRIDLPALAPHLQGAVAFRWGRHSESLLFIDDVPYSGLGTGEWTDGAPTPLGPLDAGEHTLGIHIERDTGYGTRRAPERAVLEQAELLIRDTRLLDLAAGLQVARDVLRRLPPTDPSAGPLRQALMQFYDRLPLHDRGRLVTEVDALLRELEALVYGGRHAQDVRVTLMGNAHLDLSWMWTIAKTRRKNLRSFMKQLALAERHPHHCFMQCQAPLYVWLQQDFPEVSARVREAVKGGQFLAEGGIWLEPDIQLIGLESLARQFLHGQRFFHETFGRYCRTLWLPDTFGFSQALPQLMRQAGMDLLMTTKLSWNDHTRFPHDLFRWFGPDGTEALVHFITTPEPKHWIHSYAGEATVNEVAETWDEYRGSGDSNRILVPFGFGDGGGGPEDDMLRRIAWLLKGPTGFFRVEMGGIEAFREALFDELNARSRWDELPTWHDELYLECHRGTYTSQARIKALIASAESALVAAEAARIAAGQDTRPLRPHWEALMLSHFHDVLPGTIITAVREETEASLTNVVHAATHAVSKWLEEGSEKEPAAGAVFNPHGFVFTGRIPLGDGFVFGRAVPGLGTATLPVARDPAQPLPGPTLQNARVAVTIDPATGVVTSIRDPASGREWVASGANVLECYDDRAIIGSKDAWAIEAYHQRKCLARGIRVAQIGFARYADRSECRLSGQILNSPVEQCLTLYTDWPLLYVDTRIDWREDQVALKVAGEFQVRTDFATYGIQGAALRRPNHYDRLADAARFEVPGHRWLDLSEPFHGMSLLTCGKHGFSAFGGWLRMTALRAPCAPDPGADRGPQRFSYALYPHAGDWGAANVPALAAGFAAPPIALAGRRTPERRMLTLTTDAPAGVDPWLIDAVKTAEDGEGVIVRGHEALGSRGRARLTWEDRRIERVAICNLLEEPSEWLPVTDGHTVTFDYAPFEIKTLRCY